MPAGRTWVVLGMLGVSVGAVLVLSGVAFFAGQVASWVDTTIWPAYSVLDAIALPKVKELLPAWLTSWLLGRPTSSLQELVVGILNSLPLSLGLIMIGGLIMWRAIHW